MVSSAPARILRLAASARRGDWVAFRTRSTTPHEALFDGEVALVEMAGRVRLISPLVRRSRSDVILPFLVFARTRAFRLDGARKYRPRRFSLSRATEGNSDTSGDTLI